MVAARPGQGGSARRDWASQSAVHSSALRGSASVPEGFCGGPSISAQDCPQQRSVAALWVGADGFGVQA